MKTVNQVIDQVIALFMRVLNGGFVGIRNYKSSSTGRVSNIVLNAKIDYGKAKTDSIAILNTLAESDFLAIAEKYVVTNFAGDRYGTNKGAKLYLLEGKLPKEGTKARDAVMNGIHYTKTLATVRDEMVNQMIANDDPLTASNQSIAQSEGYEMVTKGVQFNESKNKYYIFAMIHTDHFDAENSDHNEGEYSEPNRGIESAQKYAIESYCKNVLNKRLPVTKIKRYSCTPDQLAEIRASGDTVTFV
jgi:hypothetical protein